MISKKDFRKKQIIYCFTIAGEKFSVKNENVIIKDKEGKIKFQTSSYRLFAIFIIGNFSITSNFINLSKKAGFAIVIMNSGFKVVDYLGFRIRGNTLLEKKQIEYASLDIGKFIIEDKIENQISILKKQRNKDEDFKRKLLEIENIKKQIMFRKS